MALKPNPANVANSANAKGATFEPMEDDMNELTQDTPTGQASRTVTEEAVHNAADAGHVVEPATPKNTAVAVNAGTSALARPTASAVMKVNVVSGMKDAFRVEYDSLPGIGAAPGSFVLKDGDIEIGAEITLQLMSYQESWVASPNDSKAPVELVRYSDDGKVDRDGNDLAAHVEDLKDQGYSKAKIGHRVILVGELIATEQPCDHIEQLVMVDLPDSGRRAFNSYTLQASYAVAKGRKTEEEAATLRLEVTTGKTKNGEKYPKVLIK